MRRRRETGPKTAQAPPDTPEPTCDRGGERAPQVWLSRITCSQWRLTSVLGAFRLVSALLCQTAFVPDEYWQSLEVAHRMVFGYGYLTWEWQKAIRGYTHPLLFALLYQLLALLHADWPILLIVLPKVLHALLGVVCDVYVFRIAKLHYGQKAGQYALLCNLCSWFLFYCLPRTLTNSLETVLCAPLLYHWLRALEAPQLQDRRRSTRLYLALAAVSFLVRPTGALLSLPLVVTHLWTRPAEWQQLLTHCTAVGSLTLLWSLAVDWYFYQQVVVVQWNFFVFNVLQGNSSLYGAHPWHWYISQGVPVVVFSSLPLLLLGAWLSPPGRRALLWLAGWLVLVNSLLAHKEFRFIMAVLPIVSVYSGYALSQILSFKRTKALHWCCYALLLANLPMALWFSLVHQRGTLDVMNYLQSSITPNSSLLFLMPCHSTPFYSHIHMDITMEFLECPPQIDASYVDVAAQFYSSPDTWLDKRYSATAANVTTSQLLLPTHIIMFDTLVQETQNFLDTYGYKEVVRLFHTLHPQEDTHGTSVVVYVRHP